MKKILIAEDDPNILISLDFLMRKKGFDVYVARDGKEAWELAQEHTPDAVLLDVMMPYLNGYEVCEKIKANEQTAHASVIFLSAKSREEDIAQGYASGANAYITKPFSTKEIVQKVKDLLKG